MRGEGGRLERGRVERGRVEGLGSTSAVMLSVPRIGTLDFNLNGMPKPSHSSSSCSLEQLPDMASSANSETINLFEKKRTRGFWPVYSRRADGPELTVRRGVVCEEGWCV